MAVVARSDLSDILVCLPGPRGAGWSVAAEQSAGSTEQEAAPKSLQIRKLCFGVAAEVFVSENAKTSKTKRKPKATGSRAKSKSVAKSGEKRTAKAKASPAPGAAGAPASAKGRRRTAPVAKSEKTKTLGPQAAPPKGAGPKPERAKATPRPTRFHSGLPAAPAAAVAKKRSTPARAKLTPEEIAEFREVLLDKRAQLVGDVQQLQDEALSNNQQATAGNLSRMPIHMADIGSDNWDQEFNLVLLQNEQNLLKEIDEALARIERGTYGLCLATGRPISKTRLRATPWAKYCIEYARLKETGHG